MAAHIENPPCGENLDGGGYEGGCSINAAPEGKWLKSIAKDKTDVM
ncbi:hypothetical protein [Janthinobacterium sp.]|nr:hypothetical protein [Janthinobacterium sp.]